MGMISPGDSVALIPATNLICPTVVKTVTSVTTASKVIAVANPKRCAFVIFNNSSNSTYVSFVDPSVAAQCTRLIATFTSWEWFSHIIYTGVITAIRNAGSGDITVW